MRRRPVSECLLNGRSRSRSPNYDQSTSSLETLRAQLPAPSTCPSVQQINTAIVNACWDHAAIKDYHCHAVHATPCDGELRCADARGWQALDHAIPKKIGAPAVFGQLGGPLEKEQLLALPRLPPQVESPFPSQGHARLGCLIS